MKRDSSVTECDYLTCGVCFKEFPLARITTFIQHKKIGCGPDTDVETESGLEISPLGCSSCPQRFHSAWSLLMHAQFRHKLQVFLQEAYQSIGGSTLSIQGPVPDKPVLQPLESHGQRQCASQEKKDAHQIYGPEITHTSATIIDTTNNVNSSSIVSVLNHLAMPTEISRLEKIGRQPDIHNWNEIGPDRNVQNIDADENILTNNLTKPQSNVINEASKEILERSCANNSRSGNHLEIGAIDNEMLPKEQGSSEDNIGDASEIWGRAPEFENCCDRHDCGSTIIPGSHESLHKCCISVVPKKRKRHMVTKHMSSSSFRLRKKYAADRNDTRRQHDIYIDVKAPDIDALSSSDSFSFDVQSSLTPHVVGEKSQPGSSQTENPPQGLGNVVTSKRSVIIQPGGVFSIPLSYPLSSQALSVSSKATVTHSNNFRQSFNIGSSEKASSRKLISNALGQSMKSGQAPNKPHSTDSVDIPVTYQSTQNVMTGVNPSSSLTSHVTQSDVHSPPELPTTEHTSASSDLDEFWPGPGKKRRYPTSKPFKCDQCDNAFNQRIHLKKHQSKHTGVKPYKCQQCDYSTVERSHLKVHIRIHTGEKPFKCTYCEYATAQNSTLKIHFKRHHGSRMLHCEICLKSFAERDKLDSHQHDHVIPEAPSETRETPIGVMTSESANPKQSSSPMSNQNNDIEMCTPTKSANELHPTTLLLISTQQTSTSHDKSS